jgi:hypothetical protein
MATEPGTRMSGINQQTVLDCKNVFSTESGRRLLQHLEIFCGAHLNQENFNANSATQTAYNLGRNRVYRHIKSMIECDLGAQNNGQDCVIEIVDESGE